MVAGVEVWDRGQARRHGRCGPARSPPAVVRQGWHPGASELELLPAKHGGQRLHSSQVVDAGKLKAWWPALELILDEHEGDVGELELLRG